MPKICYDFTFIVIVIAVIFAFAGLRAYYYYIDKQVNIIVKQPEKTNKSIIKILAAGFTAAYIVMLFPNSKDTLDFKFYQWEIQLYAVTKALVFLCAIGFGSVTGGTYLAKLKGKSDE